LLDWFLIPRVVAPYGKLSGELADELPVSIENTSLQLMPWLSGESEFYDWVLDLVLDSFIAQRTLAPFDACAIPPIGDLLISMSLVKR
jgi:hypothetical protein